MLQQQLADSEGKRHEAEDSLHTIEAKMDGLTGQWGNKNAWFGASGKDHQPVDVAAKFQSVIAVRAATHWLPASILRALPT